MMVQLDTARVHFPDWYDDRGEWEAESKGWLQGVEVELDGGRFPLFFYDPVRLAQDLEADREQDRAVVAEPGMVVVPEVTRGAVLRAIDALVRQRFFDHLRPLASAEVNGTTR